MRSGKAKKHLHLMPRTATGPIQLSEYVNQAAGELVVATGEDGSIPEGINPEWVRWVEARRDRT